MQKRSKIQKLQSNMAARLSSNAPQAAASPAALSLIAVATSVDFNVSLEALGLNKQPLLIWERKRAEAQTRVRKRAIRARDTGDGPMKTWQQ